LNFLGLAYMFSKVSWVPIIASVPLVFLAHSLLLLIQEGGAWIRSKMVARKLFHETMLIKLSLFLCCLHYVIVVCLHLVGVIPKFRFSFIHAGFSVFTAVCPHSWLQAFGVLFSGGEGKTEDGHDFLFASMVLLLWPCFVVGPLYGLHWSYFQDNEILRTIAGGLWFLLLVMLPATERLACDRSQYKSEVASSHGERVLDDPRLQLVFRFLGLALVIAGIFTLSKPAGGVDLAYYLTALCVLDWLKRLRLWMLIKSRTKNE